MDSTAIANALDELTGSWKPSETATADDLKEARLSLASAFLSGLAPQNVHATPIFRTRTPNGDRSAIDALVQEATPPPSTDGYTECA